MWCMHSNDFVHGANSGDELFIFLSPNLVLFFFFKHPLCSCFTYHFVCCNTLNMYIVFQLYERVTIYFTYKCMMDEHKVEKKLCYIFSRFIICKKVSDSNRRVWDSSVVLLHTSIFNRFSWDVVAASIVLLPVLFFLLWFMNYLNTSATQQAKIKRKML